MDPILLTRSIDFGAKVAKLCSSITRGVLVRGDISVDIADNDINENGHPPSRYNTLPLCDKSLRGLSILLKLGTVVKCRDLLATVYNI